MPGETEAQRRARDPDWDPVYGYDEDAQRNANIADSLSLGATHFNEQNAREAATRRMMGLAPLEFSPQGYEYIGDYNPEDITVESARASLADDSGEGKEAQLMALRRMLEDSDQSVASQQSLDRYQAMQDASQMANAREQSIRQDAMARGRIGSAQDMIARQQAAQAGANQNLNAGMQAAQMAALQRLAGTQAYGQLGGQVRGQDQGLAFRNQDAINQFNLANVGARNAASMANVTNRNQAAQMNRAGAQDVMDRNVGRRDDIASREWAARHGQAQDEANLLTGQAAGYQANTTETANTIKDLLRAGGRAAAGGAG